MLPCAPVEGHIEPLHLEACAGCWDIACRQELCHTQHLLPSIMMINGFLHQQLFDIVVAARHHIDILVIPGIFLVKSLLNGKLDHMTEILFALAVLLCRHYCQIDWLGKVVVGGLLPGRFVLAFEHILELLEGYSPIE
jgi:hypothetical protein